MAKTIKVKKDVARRAYNAGFIISALPKKLNPENPLSPFGNFLKDIDKETFDAVLNEYQNNVYNETDVLTWKQCSQLDFFMHPADYERFQKSDVDYTEFLTHEMLFHAKRATHRINRLKGESIEFIEENARYELTKLYGELRALSMLDLPHNIAKTDRLRMRLKDHVEDFYYKSIRNTI